MHGGQGLFVPFPIIHTFLYPCSSVFLGSLPPDTAAPSPSLAEGDGRYERVDLDHADPDLPGHRQQVGFRAHERQKPPWPAVFVLL